MKNKTRKWFEERYPNLVEDMKKTQHQHSNGSQNPYHLEGDCWTHTIMVHDLIKSEDANLHFAAILHDIGKPGTRYEKKTGRVSFMGHECLSLVQSIDILKEAKKDFELDIVTVLKMVAWHGELWTKSDTDRNEHMSKINNKFGFDEDFYRDFVHFVKADALGRKMENEEDELWIMEQMDFLENYIPFNSSAYSKHNPKSEVVFMVGLSGSGKSTWVQKLEGYRIISIDNYLSKGKLDYNSVDYSKKVKKAHDQSLKDIKDIVSKEDNAVVDMTNLTKEMRRKKLTQFPSTKYKRTAVVFLTGEEEQKSNLAKRKDKRIPEEVLNRQKRQFELPGLDEFDEITYVLEGECIQ